MLCQTVCRSLCLLSQTPTTMAQKASTSTSSLDARTPSSGSTLSYRHLSYNVKVADGRKTLVDDVSVDIRPGELLAIMVCTSLWVNDNQLNGLPRAHLALVSSTFPLPIPHKSISIPLGKSTLLDLMSFRKSMIEGGSVSGQTPLVLSSQLLDRFISMAKK